MTICTVHGGLPLVEGSCPLCSRERRRDDAYPLLKRITELIKAGAEAGPNVDISAWDQEGEALIREAIQLIQDVDNINLLPENDGCPDPQIDQPKTSEKPRS